MEILRIHADIRENRDAFEQISIDEAFLEITEKTGGTLATPLNWYADQE